MADFLKTFKKDNIRFIHFFFLGKKKKNFLVLNRRHNFLKGMKDEMEDAGHRLKCCPEDEEWKKGESSEIGFCSVTTSLIAEFTEVPPRENVQ